MNLNRMSGHLNYLHQFDPYDYVAVVDANILYCPSIQDGTSVNGAPDEDINKLTYDTDITSYSHTSFNLKLLHVHVEYLIHFIYDIIHAGIYMKYIMDQLYIYS